MVSENILFFLLMAYLDKISNAPATPRWWILGRISVYSLWFIGYEVYCRLIACEPRHGGRCKNSPRRAAVWDTCGPSPLGVNPAASCTG